MRATSKLPITIGIQIQGRFAKHIFILQMPRNIVSLFKRFGRQCFIPIAIGTNHCIARKR
jgi:hypothetical protein